MAVVVRELGHGAQAVHDHPFEVDVHARPLGRLARIAVVIVVVGGGQRGVVRTHGGRSGQILPGFGVVPVAVGGGHRKAADHRIALVERASVEHLPLDLRIVEGRGRRQASGHLERGVAVEGEAGESRSHADAAVVRITRRRGIADVLAAAVHADVVVLPEGVVEPLALLVVVLENDDLTGVHRVFDPFVTLRQRLARIEVARRPARSGAVAGSRRFGAVENAERVRAAAVAFGDRRAQREQVIPAVHQVEFRGRTLIGPLPLENDLRSLVGRALLGGDENHAVRCARAVDTGRRGVLEHLDRLDVVRVQASHFAYGAVHQHDRIVGVVDRRTAADQEFRRRTRRSVGRGDLQAGDTAFHTVPDEVHGHAFEGFAVHFRDRRSHGLARLRAVSHDHDLLQHRLVLLHRDVDHRTAADQLFAFRVTDVREEQDRAGLRLDRIGAVGPGGRAARGVLHQHRGADQRASRRVADTARHAVLPLRFRSAVVCQHDRAVHYFVAESPFGEYVIQNPLQRGVALAYRHVAHRHGRQRRFVGEKHARLLGESVRKSL